MSLSINYAHETTMLLIMFWELNIFHLFKFFINQLSKKIGSTVVFPNIKPN